MKPLHFRSAQLRGRRAVAVLGVAASVAVLGLGLTPARAAFFSQSITNKTGAAANDVSLNWVQGVFQVKVKANITVAATAQDAPANKIWAVAAAQGMTVPNAGTADALWLNNGAVIPILSGQWTNNGANIGAVTILGKPVKIDKDAFNKASATFSNDQPTAVTYTGVGAYINNSAANYNIDNFTTLTGTQVAEPTTFTLGPAGSGTDTMTLDLGTVNPNGYELVFGHVALSSTPSETFLLQTADVPEPASLSAAMLAAGAVLKLSRRKRRIPH